MDRSNSRPRVEREHALRLLVAYHRHGDVGARNRLITELLPFVRHLARRLCPPSASLEDLMQVASLALVKAIDRFDVDRHRDLFKYLVPTVMGEMKRYHRENGWAVRVPRSLQERSATVRAAVGELGAELGRSPSPREVAEHLGLSREEVVEAFEATRSATTAASLDVEVEHDGEQSDTVGSLIGGDDTGYDRVEERVALADALGVLDDRERMIIGLRYVDGLTQAQIGTIVGVSQMQISRLLGAALTRLHDEMDPAEPMAA